MCQLKRIVQIPVQNVGGVIGRVTVTAFHAGMFWGNNMQEKRKVADHRYLRFMELPLFAMVHLIYAGREAIP